MNFIGKIEICEKPEDKVAGRALIKMSALKISKNDSDNNDNGLNWVRQFVEDNKRSLIGGAYKVRFVDDEKTYPSDHGDMVYDEDGNVIFPDTDSVGTIQDVYIETVNMDGENIDVLQTQGYIYTQSYPNFYKWLKDETNRGTVYGSIEINGKAGAKNIVYANESKNADGSPKQGRKPQIFDFVSLAILSSFVPPADKYSRVIEVNQKGEMMPIKIDNSKGSAIDQESWNVDDGAYFRKCKEASNARSVFNEAYLITELPEDLTTVIESNVKYPHHVFEGDTLVVSYAGIKAAAQRLGANDDSNTKAKSHLRKHYRALGLEMPSLLMPTSESNACKVKEMASSEKIEQSSLNGGLSVCELREVLEPAIDEKIKSISGEDSDDLYTWIRDIYPDTKELVVNVCFKRIEKYYIADYHIENGTAVIGNLSEVENTWVPVSVDRANNIENQMKGETREMTMTELNQKLDANQVEINELTTKNKDLSEAVVKANKSLEETNTELNSAKAELEECKKELEALRAEKEKAEAEAELNQKKTDAKNYFDTEIVKNGFAEEEINSLKTYVESGDLDGLKSAESELCTKKFKEMKSTASTIVEVNNSNAELFCSTKPVTAPANNDTDGAELFK